MPSAWASCGRGEDPLLARDLDAAGIRPLGTGQDLEQRRLAGAVLAEQAVDLAGVEIERDVVQRLHAGVELGDPGDPQQRFGHGRRSETTGAGRAGAGLRSASYFSSPSRSA